MLLLLDAAAQAFLGATGLLLGLARTASGGGAVDAALHAGAPGAGFGAYAGLDRGGLALASGAALLRALPGLALAGCAIRPPRGRAAALGLAAAALVAALPDRAPLLFPLAALAGAALLPRRRARPSAAQIM